jgi:hypothetical protein
MHIDSNGTHQLMLTSQSEILAIQATYIFGNITVFFLNNKIIYFNIIMLLNNDKVDIAPERRNI